jgi:hypothetical protein
MSSLISKEWSDAVTARAGQLLGQQISKEFFIGTVNKKRKFKSFDGLIVFVSEDGAFEKLPLDEQYQIGVIYNDGSIECMHQIDHYKNTSEHQKELQLKNQLSQFMIAEFLLFDINCVFCSL